MQAARSQYDRAVVGAVVRSGRVRAFTLTELVVSVGILSLMMTIVGAVFKLTMNSNGQANALMEVSQSLQVLEETLRELVAAKVPQGVLDLRSHAHESTPGLSLHLDAVVEPFIIRSD